MSGEGAESLEAIFGLAAKQNIKIAIEYHENTLNDNLVALKD